MPPKTKTQQKNQAKRKASKKNGKNRAKEMTDDEWDHQERQMASVPAPQQTQNVQARLVELKNGVTLKSDEPTFADVLKKVNKDPELLQKTKVKATWVPGNIPPSTIKKMSWADMDELEDDDMGYTSWELTYEDGYDSC
tara:strand:- start:93 stop:509 length:417 start_codon:yes stop_codon:yes gene_type:complete